MKRIGILGFGNVGHFLVDAIQNGPLKEAFELAFVWNRSTSKLEHASGFQAISGPDMLEEIEAIHKKSPIDLIVEVCHPDVMQTYGLGLLEISPIYVTSITAFANQAFEQAMRQQCHHTRKSVYFSSGAAWGIQDIVKMNAIQTIQKLHVTMSFHADALVLKQPLQQEVETYLSDTGTMEDKVLYQGTVRGLAPFAPNNVNTMACLSLAASTLGMDHVEATLIAHKHSDFHIVTIEVEGPNGFNVITTRKNPSKKGAVTGAQTYNAFMTGIQMIHWHEKPGFHFY